MAETSQVEVTTSSQANSPKETRPSYEIGFHVVPSAEIISETAPSRIRLAYTVVRATSGHHEKFDEAYFGTIKFATERENIPALEVWLRANREVLRFLLVETIREDLVNAPRRATFTSDRLEGETIKKPVAEPEKSAEVSEEDLDKTIDAIVS